MPVNVRTVGGIKSTQECDEGRIAEDAKSRTLYGYRINEMPCPKCFLKGEAEEV